MAAQSNAPIIIKRVKKVTAAGHHGGAWKVAYADFVTAMMAFFMLMWLLNATTEQQRKGIADYFSPTIPITRASGGGDGAFGGDSVFSEEMLAQNGQGGVVSPPQGGGGIDAAVEARALAQIEDMLTGNSGESMVSDLARRHILTEVTDEGLVIEIFDLEGEPIFANGGAEPTALLTDLVAMLGRVSALVKNGIAIEGHVAARPIVLAGYSGWDLSADRADRVRELLEAEAVAPARIKRVTGHADRSPAARNPMAARNNRIVVILLKSAR
jgi:chemotaxis protein MotB